MAWNRYYEEQTVAWLASKNQHEIYIIFSWHEKSSWWFLYYYQHKAVMHWPYYLVKVFSCSVLFSLMSQDDCLVLRWYFKCQIIVFSLRLCRFQVIWLLAKFLFVLLKGQILTVSSIMECARLRVFQSLGRTVLRVRPPMPCSRLPWCCFYVQRRRKKMLL